MTDTETATQAVKYAIDTWGEFAHEAIAAEVIKALSASPKGDDLEPVADDLVERLQEGPIRTGDTEDGEYELFDVDEAAPTMLEAASALQSLKAERDAAREAIRLHAAWGFPADIQALTVKLEAAEAENATLKREIAELREFVSSFHVTVVDNTYKDVSLHLEQPHALSLRLGISSDKSWIYADFEARRAAALTQGGK